MVAKVRALDDATRCTTNVPSGWTPLELLWHLVHMERRWLAWVFVGRQLEDPWADTPQDRQRWAVPADLTLKDVESWFATVAAETSSLLAATPLDTLASDVGRLRHNRPTLHGVLLHVLQEYARHAGHLDVVVELAGGPTGE